MDVTLLGSGDAVGVPAPLCGCEYCRESPRRRRPGLLVETDAATVLLDAPPELREQLAVTDTTALDAAFVTHAHDDHWAGLTDLGHAAMGFEAHVGIEGGYLPEDAFDPGECPTDPEFAVRLSARAREHLAERRGHLLEHLSLGTLEAGEAVEVGDLAVEPFPVRHARPAFDTLGFVVDDGANRVVYAPDMWEFLDGPPVTAPALAVVEGAALFRTFGHGERAALEAALAALDADRTVLVNLNEHLNRTTTAELRGVADAYGYELGRDFARYDP